MAVPKSVVKISKNGIKYESKCDFAKYTLKELTRAALRDVGKFVCREFRNGYYSTFFRRTGKVGRFTQYWVRSLQEIPDLQVGLKPGGFYGGFQEFGTKKQLKYNLLTSAAHDNIPEIVKIESQYLSALESEAKALSLISESDYESGTNE